MKKNIKPLLSICIPTYNRKELLEESLNKITYQLNEKNLLEFIEVIISDNNSDDGTEDMVKSFGNIYNINYFRNSYNIGFLNLLKVAEYANGEYLWLLADDDCITEFALEYVLDIIKKEEFYAMFCKAVSSENMNIHVPSYNNEYNLFNGIDGYLSYLRKQNKGYKDLISYFSFYSILIVKTQYFREGLKQYSSMIEGNDFPHDIIIYHDLKDKKIIVPNNVFVIGRLLNESYVSSTKLIKSFNNCMNFIEERNDLSNDNDWLKIKSICKKGWRKNIILGLIIGKLHIDYKHNKFIKRIYWFYKKYIQ